MSSGEAAHHVGRAAIGGEEPPQHDCSQTRHVRRACPAHARRLPAATRRAWAVLLVADWCRVIPPKALRYRSQVDAAAPLGLPAWPSRSRDRQATLRAARIRGRALRVRTVRCPPTGRRVKGFCSQL